MEKGKRKIDAIKGLVKITKRRERGITKGDRDGNLEQAPHITSQSRHLYTDKERRWWPKKDKTKDK